VVALPSKKRPAPLYSAVGLLSLRSEEVLCSSMGLFSRDVKVPQILAAGVDNLRIASVPCPLPATREEAPRCRNHRRRRQQLAQEGPAALLLVDPGTEYDARTRPWTDYQLPDAACFQPQATSRYATLGAVGSLWPQSPRIPFPLRPSLLP
jgi:hypothetical protein